MAFVNQSKRDGQPLSPLCYSRRRRWHPLFDASSHRAGSSLCGAGAEVTTEMAAMNAASVKVAKDALSSSKSEQLPRMR